MDHGLPEQRQILPDLLRLSQETGIPPVATNDSHYLTRDDAAAQDVLLCIGTGKTLNDAKRMKFYNSEFYVKNPEEMSDVFRPYSLEAVQNTAAIADRITPSVIVDTGLKIPTYPCPGPTGSPDEYLEDLAKEGLERRLARSGAAPGGLEAAEDARRVRRAPRVGALRHPEDGALELLPDRLGLHQVRQGRGDPRRAGPRLGGRLARRLVARHHRRRPAAVRPPLRALPEPRPHLDARHRRRPLRAPPRRGHRVRAPRSTGATTSGRSSRSTR